MIKKFIFSLALVIALGALALFVPTPVRAAGILYTVTSLADVADFSDGVCTLREAIVSSNGGVITNCGPASSDADEIEFAVGGTIMLNSALPPINDTLTIGGSNNITISGNQAYRIFTVNGSKSLTLKDITLTEALTTDEGGAIRNFGTLYVSNCKFIFNRSNAGGGAIYNFGVADISGSEFSYNISSTGGAIMNPGILGLSSTKFLVNLADVQSSGGAIWSSGPVIISASEFRQNKAGSGGAIHAKRIVDTTTLSIGGSLFEENLTLGEYPDANGGALLVNNLAATVATSTFSKNGGQSGGAIFVMPQGALTLTNSTLRDNSQTTNGAGLYNQGTAHLTNVTFRNNSAGNTGGGIENANSANNHLNLKNVIVADSKSGGNCNFAKAPDSLNLNLSSDNSCGFGAGRDGVKIKMGPLETNGGPTLTHRLLPGSPAIDNGTNQGAPVTDQRGVSRPQNNVWDVGAFEFQPCSGAPPKPQLLAPAKKASVTTPQVVLDWAGPDCVAKFNVVVRLGSKSGPIVFSKAKIKTTQVITSALANNQTYFWQVLACNAAGCAHAWSKFQRK